MVKLLFLSEWTHSGIGVGVAAPHLLTLRWGFGRVSKGPHDTHRLGAVCGLWAQCWYQESGIESRRWPMDVLGALFRRIRKAGITSAELWPRPSTRMASPWTSHFMFEFKAPRVRKAGDTLLVSQSHELSAEALWTDHGMIRHSRRKRGTLARHCDAATTTGCGCQLGARR